MDFTFYMPVRVLSGPGCVRAGGKLLRGWAAAAWS